MLTFIITALTMTVVFLMDNNSKQDAERNQISEYSANEQRRRERSAYDKGLYDGRRTDAYYRQCLKKFTGREQTDVILNGINEGNERDE